MQRRRRNRVRFIAQNQLGRLTRMQKVGIRRHPTHRLAQAKTPKYRFDQALALQKIVRRFLGAAQPVIAAAVRTSIRQHSLRLNQLHCPPPKKTPCRDETYDSAHFLRKIERANFRSNPGIKLWRISACSLVNGLSTETAVGNACQTPGNFRFKLSPINGRLIDFGQAFAGQYRTKFSAPKPNEDRLCRPNFAQGMDRGMPIVAVHPGQFLDHSPPRELISERQVRRHDLEHSAARLSFGFHSQSAQQLVRLFSVDFQTEQFLDALFAQLKLSVDSFCRDNSPRHRASARPPANSRNKIHRPVQCRQVPSGIDAALETMRRFAMQTEPFGGAANRRRRKVRAFKQQRRGSSFDLGIDPAHNAGKSHWLIAVANQ